MRRPYQIDLAAAAVAVALQDMHAAARPVDERGKQLTYCVLPMHATSEKESMRDSIESYAQYDTIIGT